MFKFEEHDASNYLDVENEDLVVTNLLDKYEISSKTTFLYNVNDDYHALMEYISEQYIDEKVIPEDIIEQLTSNINFKTYLLTAIQEKMNNILSDNSTIVFKEIVTIVNLLSFGKKFEIFESYNFYNLEELGLLFREFEEKLKELKDSDERDFIITFNHYTILIEVVNELCTINSTDVLRKKTINPIIDTLSETINIVKYNVKLDEIQINTLNNILGKLLFYYSHIPFINTTNKDSQYLIDEFKFNFEKLCDGYQLSKNTNFGGDLNNEEYYKIFLNSNTTLLSTLIYKLDITYKYDEFKDIEKFKKIIELYISVIEHTQIPKFEDVLDFKTHLLNNYIYIYNKELETDNYLYMIDEFIENPDFNSSNMHIIHSLVLFASNINDEKLLKILEILIKLDKFKNDYHEFYKLNVCDVIINRFTYSQSQIMTKELVKGIVEYVETNKIASHLMSIYSKIYLSLSLYYSYYSDFKSLEYSKLYYFNYVGINGKDLLENEYSKLNRDILYNHGKKSIEEMDLENVMISDSKCIEIGTKLLKIFFEQQEINLKYTINQKLSNIVTDIFTNDGLNDDLLNKHIEGFISRDIFHGLIFVSIEGLCENECTLIDLGYEKIEIPLIDGYKLRMAYSNVYKNIFENIYENNKDYIKQNIINLIISYIKSIPIYYDKVTRLYNLDKLQTDLNKKNEEEFIFIEYYINNLVDLNKKYSYSKTNALFKEYANKINEISPAYRMSGPKLGLILNSKEDYNSLIEKIKKVSITYNSEVINLDLIFAVTWGNKNNILEKSSHCVSLALTNKEKYYEFK
ncbi:hypothetical protein [Arcobacter sp. LA11]|uniref:hypothetical protein n=1 Tax=Arcobacter sp. LA11 TaxID=1898176 RepID=UPI0009335114|nr:hypothetical protein [Arcobacter sp. LA11]